MDVVLRSQRATCVYPSVSCSLFKHEYYIQYIWGKRGSVGQSGLLDTPDFDALPQALINFCFVLSRTLLCARRLLDETMPISVAQVSVKQSRVY
jgi:hypothetical protein